jgi:hypothetical protein
MATFSNFVFDTTTQNPPQIGVGLSASNNSVVFLPTVLVYNTSTAVNKNVFTAPPLSATQVTAITGSSVLSGFYSGWVASGIAAGTEFIDTQFNALTTVYGSTTALKTQFDVLTAAIVPTTKFSSGTYQGKQPVGILFDLIPTASTASVTLSVTDRIQFKVAPEYNGKSFALYFRDGATTVFTVATATATQSVTASIGYDNRGPNERRRFAIEG